MNPALLTLRVNGEEQSVAAGDSATLLEVLRENLHLTGTKHGCELGECGACTVLVDGVPVLSCLTLARRVEGFDVLTVEGLARNGRPHPLQEAFVAKGAAQCGYCTPGMLMTAAALLDRDRHPSIDEVKEALAGNLCRCTGYIKILEAVVAAGVAMERP